MIGQVHAVSCGEHYYISPYHRQANPTNDKCIWTIPCPEELQCFDDAISNTWVVADKAWGIRSSGLDNFNELGINYERSALTIAKFIKGAGNWHGYPADVNRRPQDRPNPEVLDKWRANNYISKPFRARIQGGRI